jgi:hypothetical protein
MTLISLGAKKKPMEGEWVLVRCEGFSESAWEIAQYMKGKFISQANGQDVREYVIEWASLPY